MRIGIDARALTDKNPSGIGIYLINVLRVFKEKHKEYGISESEIFLYSDRQIKYHEDIVSYFVKREIPGKIGVIWCSYGLKKYLIKDEIDIFWGPNYVIPFNMPRIKTVQTIHDVALMINPSWGRLKNSIVHNTFVKAASKKSDIIISDSYATTNDIKKILKIKAEKIRTIYAAFDRYELNADPAKVREELFTKSDIKEKKYFVYVGTVEPRKNLINIIKGFDCYCSQNDIKDTALIIAGGKGWNCENIYAQKEKSINKDKIYFTGYISVEEKYALYKAAIAGIMASYYEGFGIPVLEAMSMGCIEIITNISSLPEVGGEAAIYIDNPDDYEAIANQLSKVASLSDDERNGMVQKGYNQCDKFSWEKCGEEILKVLIDK